VIPNSILISPLVLVASPLNLSSRATTSVLPSFSASPMASISSFPGVPRFISLSEAIHHLITSRRPRSSFREWSASVTAGLVHLDTGIPQQHRSTGGKSTATSNHEGSHAIASLVDIDARMGQEDGDNGVMPMLAGRVQGAALVGRVHLEIGIILENLLHHLHVSLVGCPEELHLCHLGEEEGGGGEQQPLMHQRESAIDFL